jgi:hypothetical protein
MSSVDGPEYRRPWPCVASEAAAKAAWFNKRRVYRRLRRAKCDEFWWECISASRSNSSQLWQAVYRTKPPPSDAIDVEQFRAFCDNVGRIRDATSVRHRQRSLVREGVELRALRAVTPG